MTPRPALSRPKPAPAAWLAALLAVAASLAAGDAAAVPPARNLVVEMRVVEAADQNDLHAGTATVTSSRGAVGSSGVWGAATSTSRELSEQRVLVLNGASASLRLATVQALADTEVSWTPWGPAATVRTQWVELANGMDVRPRWPGGDAPVTLDIAAQRATPTAQGIAPQLSVLTTVQVALGEWVGVARLQRRQDRVSSNGFGAATSSQQRQLQVRVSLP